MNMKRARFWRNLLLFSALSSASSVPFAHAQEGVARSGGGAAAQNPPGGPGVAGVPGPEGYVPLSSSPYMPLDDGYNYARPMPPMLPSAEETLRNSRRTAIGPRFDIGQFLGERLGVEGNETNFNFLLPMLVGSDHEMIFVDGRGLVSHNGDGGASAGVGYRVFRPEFNRLFGISGWLDYDNGTGQTYKQAGVSFESLGNWLDVRVNGYIPIGEQTNELSRIATGDFVTIGSGLFENKLVTTQSSYYGFDAEIGGPLPLLGRYGVSGYVGGYWLDSKTDETAVGPRARIEANVTDAFRVNVTASHDSVFGSSAWLNMQMSLPDGRSRRWFRPAAVEDRMLWTVNRSYRVHTHSRVDTVPEAVLAVGGGGGAPALAAGGGNGQPVRIIFVDPDAAVNGDGTIERPFNTLQGFSNTANNTLIVLDGSPIDALVRGRITLFDDQKLVSTQIVAQGGVQLNTTNGVITLPAFNFGDVTPVSPIFSSPTGGTLVTLQGNHTEVAGITFEGLTGNSAVANSSGISGTNLVDFNIHHNTFRNYTNGAVLNNATGVGLFQANTLNGLPGTSNDGFRVTNSGAGRLDLLVDAYQRPTTTSTAATTANSFSGNDGAGIRVTARNRAQINAHIVGNTVTNNGDGIVLDSSATRGVIRGSVANNLIDGNRGEDRNNNGILDPGEDLDGDGLLRRGNGLVLNANNATLELATLGEDLNANGILDPAEDRNGNGVLDRSEDTNGNGMLDPSEDRNGNGVLDPAEDANGNGALDPGEDLNGNGLLDPAEDANGNGMLDPAEDRNGNGVLDLTEDKNGNGLLDPAEDRNGNGVLDAGEDRNGNGILDVTEDTNGNGRLDAGEDTNGNGLLDAAEDVNSNGLLDGGYFITNNVITNNSGDGIKVVGTNNSNINLLITQNTIGRPEDRTSGNGGRGLSITADSGVINAQIGFLQTEDVNLNGVLDTEDANGNGRLDLGEDANGNGVLDSEDTNANGVLDIADPRYGNTLMGNQGGGILVDLTGNAVGNIVALNNVIGSGDGNLTFLIDGRTDGTPFTFSNSSQRGINLTNLVWNIAPAGLEFDTIAGAGVTGVFAQDFTVSNSTVALTGLTSVNGSTTGTPVAGTNNVTYGVVDPSPSLTMQYSRFLSVNGVLDAGEDANNNGRLDPGEDLPQPFTFAIDVDRNIIPLSETVFGSQFIGSTVTATFSSGHILNGSFQAVPGNLLAAQFVPSSTSTSITGSGIEFRASGTAVLNAPTIFGNDVRFQGGAGIAANATEDGQINNLLIQGNTVQNNGGASSSTGISLNTFKATTASITGSIFNNRSNFNVGPGLALTADSGSIVVDQINGNDFSSNTSVSPNTNGNGIRLQTRNNGTIAVGVTNNLMINNANDGFAAIADTGTITVNQFLNNSMANSGANGIRLEANSGGTIRLLPSEDLNRNGVLDDGEDVNNNGLLDLGFSTTRLAQSEDLNANGVLDVGEDVNGNRRLDVGEDLNSNGLLDVSEDLNGNGLLDIGEDLNLNGLLDLAEDTNGNGVLDIIVTNVTDNSIGNGLFVTGNAGNFELGVINGLSANRTIAGAGGIVIDTTDSVLTGQFTGSSLIGRVSAPPLNVNSTLGAGFSLTATNGTFGVTVEDNTVDLNAGAGINFTLRQDAFGSFIVRNNTITRTQEDNFTEDANANGILDVLEDLNGNGRIDSRITDAAGEGVFVQLIGADVLRNARGELSNSIIDGNIIGGNVTSAALAATVRNASHGIGIDIREDTAIRGLQIGNGNLIANNAGDGINVLRRDNAEIENVLINNNAINNNGDLVAASGRGDGINIIAQDGGRTLLGFQITQNNIVSNFRNGINLHVEGDARLNIDITRNLIDTNGTANLLNQMNGILTTENFADPTDMREIGGNWLANQITNNPGYGIQFNSTATNIFNQSRLAGDSVEKRDVPPDLAPDLTRFGVMPELVIGGSLIATNGLDGIEFNGPGLMTIDSNDILSNGRNALLATFNPQIAAAANANFDDNGNGIDIQAVMRNPITGIVVDQNAVFPQAAPEPQAASPKVVNITRNLIQNNANDGVEIRHASRPSTRHDDPLHPGYYPLSVIVRENTIENNGGRGVDILNQGGLRVPEFEDTVPASGSQSGATLANQFSPVDTTVRLLDNKIASNAKEGIYVVNTSALAEIQTGATPVPNQAVTPNSEDPTRGLNSTGSGNEVPRLALEIHNNLIIKNGQQLDVNAAANGTLTGSGLVLRVGTSDDGSLLSPDADFVTDTSLSDEGLPVVDENGFFRRSQPGGMIAKVTNNSFEGNFGSDVYIESFTSTGAAQRVVARLDLMFENNVGDSLDVTNFGAFYPVPERANAQRASQQGILPGNVTEIFGRVVGVHTSLVRDDPGVTGDNATLGSFFADDTTDLPLGPTFSNLDDRSTIYNGRELVFRSGFYAQPSARPEQSPNVTTYNGLAGGNHFSVTPAFVGPNPPQDGDVFQVQLAQQSVFDIVLLSGDPRLGPVTPIAVNPATGAFLNINANITFLDEDDTVVPDSEEPALPVRGVILNNFQTLNGRATALTNPNIYHVDQNLGVFVDLNPPGQGRGALQSNPLGFTPLNYVPGTTSNQTLQLRNALPLANVPRDTNLFVITSLRRGRGDPTFRMSGAMVASGAGINTNRFTNENLGFDGRVSLESGLPFDDELPFEWGQLPDANRTRIQQFFAPLAPLTAAPISYKDFDFPNIVVP